MKKPTISRLGATTMASAIAILLHTSIATAATLYWDGNGAGATGNPPTANVGGAGTWDAGTTANWWNGTAYQLWNGAGGLDIADFRGTAGAVTVSGTVSVNQILIRSNTYPISGGTVNFTGSQGILDVFTTNSSSFTSGATGPLKVQATGNVANLSNASPLTISGSTTLTSFELSLATDSNHIILGNAAALGNSSTTVKLTKGVLNLGNSAGASNFSYGAWTTDLAGGTIRARFDTATWNGATSLSANAQLMTRNAAGVKLIFSSTATVNLNANTLNLMAGATATGIELNGVISGSGNLATIENKLGGSDLGNGTTTLGAANTFSGSATTTANLGTLALGNVNALQNATLNTGASAGTQAVTFTVAGTNTYNIGGLAGADSLAIGANNLSVGAKTGSHNFAADISGTGGLTKVGATSTQTLSAATSYTGATSINAGTLALGASGALSSSSNVAIAAGATFDVSALASYTHGTSASLTASGSGTTPGSDAAEIKGGTTVALGTRPVTLNYSPDSFSGDSNDPALYVSSGSLSLSGPVSIVNNGASPLGNGTYTLVSQTTGTITGSPTLSGTVGGNGIAAGKTAILQISGGSLELVVQDGIPTTVSLARNVSTTASTTYGDTLQFDVGVSPGGATGLVELRDGGISGPVIGIGTLTAGSVTITPAANVVTAGTHSNVVALYLGDSAYQSGASSSLSPAQVVSAKNLTISGAVANSKYADGTTAATLSGGSLSGVVTGDESSVTLNQTGSFATASAGTGIAVTGTCTLSGSKSANYTVTQPTGLTADIHSTAIWTGASDNLWNTSGNWIDTLVPDGANVTADFTTLDITADTTVNLNSPHTIGKLKFADADDSSPAGWTIANNATPANILTLAGTTPTVDVGIMDFFKTANISAVVAGSAGLKKSGIGTLNLSGANTYTGVTLVDEGTLKTGNANALGAVSDGTTVSVNGTLDFNSIALTNEAITLAGGKLSNDGTADQISAVGGAVTVTADSTFGGLKRWDFRASGASLTINSGITVTKDDLNVVAVVARPFTNNGTVVINSGAFAFHTGGTYSGNFTVNSGGELQLGSFNSPTPLILTSAITSNGGSLTFVDSSGAGGLPTFSGNIGMATSSITTLGGAASGNFTGVFSGNADIYKTGAGTAVLTGINTYTGTTTINAGEIRLGNNSAINTTSSITANSGGRLGIADGVTTGSGKSVSITGGGGNFFGALQGASGTAEWQGTVVAADFADTRVGVNAGTFTVSGVISGGGIVNGLTLRPNTGTLVLSAANTWLGDTRIVCGSGGIVQLAGGNDRLPVATKLLFGLSNTSGILDLNGQNQEIAGLSVVSGTTNEVRSSSGSPVLTVNTPTATPSTYAGLITGTTGLTKKGPETLTISGNNTYTGNTVVEAGTLLINGIQSFATGPVSVTGGTLGGTGNLGGDITVSAAGTIAPGVSTGTLLVTAADLTAGGTLAIDINDAATEKCDKLDAIGDINITNAKLNVSFTGTPSELSYTIAIAAAINGTFAPANVTGLPAGYSLAYTATEILLVKGGYDSWISTFSGLSDTTTGGDPDNDGMENLLEYVLNGNPGTSDPLILPDLDASGSNFVFTFTRRLDSKDDAQLFFQHNTDLGAVWTEIAIPTATSGAVVITPVDAVTEQVQVTISKDTNTRMFGRLRATK